MSSRSASLAAVVAIIWGLCFVLIQASLPSPAPLLLAALRALIGGGILAAWMALRGRQLVGRRRDADLTNSHPKRSGLPRIGLLIALALTNAALALGAMYLAAGRAEAAVASILAGGQPLILAAAGWALFGERLSGRAVTGLAVAMAGVVVVATASSGGTGLDGVLLAVIAVSAPAAGTVLMRRLAPDVDLLQTTSAQFLLGGAMLLAASGLLEPWGAVSWSPAVLVGLLVLGVFGTGLAYVAWFWLLDRISLVRLGAILFLVPVTGFVTSIVTGDRPAPDELIGIAALLLGMGIVAYRGPTPTAKGLPDARPNPPTVQAHRGLSK